ncbi:MAG: EamA family transporter [Tannerellaceae bacterium]|jgi:drug/metabolite transporter (DMT)-like permease|nr:EamA family transporter [Tannerellaceae bacterium]
MKQLAGTGKRKINIVVAYFLIYVIWGSTYYFIGVALKGLPPFLLGAFRFSIAGLILLVLCYFRNEPLFKKSLIKKSAVSGIVLLFIDMAVVMLAQKYVSSSLVAIIASSTAIWIMALDAPMWKKNFRSPPIIIGIITGFLGVMMLYLEQFRVDNHAQDHSEYGILLLIFGCISWALGTLYAKYRSSGEEEVNAFAGSAWQMIFASILFWICTIIKGDPVKTDFNAVPVSSWLSLVYLIIFGSILAYSAYVWLLKVRPATEVSTHAYVNPFIAVFLGVVLGKEDVTWVQFAGLIVILLSVLLINHKKKKKHRY